METVAVPETHHVVLGADVEAEAVYDAKEGSLVVELDMSGGTPSYLWHLPPSWIPLSTGRTALAPPVEDRSAGDALASPRPPLAGPCPAACPMPGDGPPSTHGLLDNPVLVKDLPTVSIPGLLAKCVALQATLIARMAEAVLSPPVQSDGPTASNDRLLNAEEAATIAGSTARWFYRHAKDLPFTRRLSRKMLRFSEAGLRKWIAGRRAT